MATLLGSVFAQEDPIALALGVTPAEFQDLVRLFCPQAAADGLTVVARRVDTGEMVGTLLTEDAGSAPPSGMERMSQKFDPIIDLTGQLDAEYLQGKDVLPGEWLHLFLLGVPQPFGGRGVGQQLIASCLENGVCRGYRLAFAEATNRVSQHIFRKHGFVEQVRRSYRDYRYRGEKVFTSIKGHAEAILMDKELKEED